MTAPRAPRDAMLAAEAGRVGRVSAERGSDDRA